MELGGPQMGFPLRAVSGTTALPFSTYGLEILGTVETAFQRF